VRRQQLGLPTDDTPEAGAPPPGLADETDPSETLGAKQQTSSKQADSKVAGEAKKTEQKSIKKHKKAQVVQAAQSPRSAKPSNSHSSSHGRATR